MNFGFAFPGFFGLIAFKEAIEQRRIVNGKTISDESIRKILEDCGISYQRTKTWKESNDPEFEIKKSALKN